MEQGDWIPSTLVLDYRLPLIMWLFAVLFRDKASRNAHKGNKPGVIEILLFGFPLCLIAYAVTKWEPIMLVGWVCASPIVLMLLFGLLTFLFSLVWTATRLLVLGTDGTDVRLSWWERILHLPNVVLALGALLILLWGLVAGFLIVVRAVTRL